MHLAEFVIMFLLKFSLTSIMPSLALIWGMDANFVWGGQHSNTTSQRAFILQKYALRIISFSVPQTPSAPLFHNFKILTIFDLVKLLNILFIHKYLNFNLLSDLCDTFNFVYIDHNYATRNRTMGLLKLPLMSTYLWFTNFLLSSRF